jgi:hypothetical protein
VSGVKYHRTAIGFEDGGFEIRDQIFWIDADHTTPVVFARRPLEEATIKENVMRYGTGALNIDGCRIGTSGGMTKPSRCIGDTGTWQGNRAVGKDAWVDNGGRYPANVILSVDAAKRLDEQSGFSSGTTSGGTPVRNLPHEFWIQGGGGFKTSGRSTVYYSDSGGASRFFKTSNTLPDLLAYITTLILPPGGLLWSAVQAPEETPPTPATRC